MPSPSSFRPKKIIILVPVGCQLRSWVGREFILIFLFYFFQRQRMIGRLFSFKNEKILVQNEEVLYQNVIIICFFIKLIK